MFKIDRSGLVQQIFAAIETRSVLLSGSPGIGKSWLLTAVARKFQEGKRVLALAAENYPVNSLDELQKMLGLKNDLLSVLSGLGDHSCLVIDGLDALRTENSQRVFRRLIKAVGMQVPNCRVLASIRTFDLQQSDELRDLFTDQGFERIHVRPLNAGELAQACQQEPGLTGFMVSANAEIIELLTNPYMLNLAVNLLRDGIAEKDLLGATSEVELLTKYWNRRVESKADGQLRKTLLRQIASQMSDNRQLSIPSSSLDKILLNIGPGTAFHDLKSDEILRESITNQISFEHNILFDYAGARLLFDETNVINVLSDPSVSIFLRPSLSYFFLFLWVHSNSTFWEIAFKLFDPNKKYGERASIIPAVTIFESAKDMNDLSPLLKRQGEDAVRGIHNVLRAVQTFNAFAPKRRQLWLDFLEALSSRPTINYVNEYISALSSASQAPGLSQAERVQLGKISRNFLRWGWEYGEGLEDRAALSLAGALSSRVLPIAIALFDTHPRASRKLISTIIARLGNKKADSHEAFRLAQGINSIIEHDPQFAYRIYVELFNYVESSEETTDMGSGSIMRMTSNRAQDFHSALYGLQRSFDGFINKSALWAVRAAVDTVNAEIPRSHPRSSPIETFTFEYFGAPAIYTADYSEIWDKGYSQDESLTLLSHVLSRTLSTSNGHQPNSREIRMLFSEVARRNRLGVVWKRIFETPQKDYTRIAKYLLPLLTNPQFLAAPEMAVTVGDTLTELYSANVLSAAQRKVIEETILAIPSAHIILRYERPESLRNRLLSRIPAQLLITEAAKGIISELANRGETSDNKPYHRVSVSTGTLTDEDWLRHRGAKVEDEQVKQLLNAYRPLQAFHTRYTNEVPPLAESLALEPSLLQVAALIDDKLLDEVAATQAEGVLAGALETIVKSPELPRDSSLMTLARGLILKLSRHPAPEPEPDESTNFDKPFWGSPIPRIEAAQGVMYLIWNWGLDPQLEGAAFRLAEDPVPAVRFQIAANVLGFYKHDKNSFWKLVDKIIDTESTPGVISGVLDQLGRIAGNDPDNTALRLTTVINRGFSKEDNHYILTPVANTLVGLAVYRTTEKARKQIEAFHQEPLKHASMLGQIIFVLNSQILEARDETISADVRDRAISIQQNIISHLNKALDEVLAAKSFNPESYQTVLRLTDSIVFRIYIGLDVDPDLRNDKAALSEEQRSIYFSQYRPMLESLLSPRVDGRPHLTSSAAYNLMKTFNAVLIYDPEQILHWAAQACKAAAHLSYHYDSMAIGETVKLVERVLADHHELLRKADVAQSITEMLDIFVSAGWSAAVQLVMRLDEALR